MKNHRGAGIVFVLVILMILFLFILSFLLLFAAWEKHSFLTLAGNEASRFTKTGVEEALWQVDHNPRESDGLTDAWRTAFAGTDVDNNEDGMPDSRWITVNNSRGGISGRYAVLVEDENGAVNINAAGNAGGSFNEGHTVAEIGLLPELCGKSGAASIASFRYGADGAPGKRLVDDDGNAERLGKDRVDNDGDGWIDEGDEGLDDPGEFVQEGPAGDDRPYFSPSDVKLAAGIGQETFRRLRPFIAPWSYDLNETRDGTRRINLNTAPYETLFRLLRDLGYEERQAAQIACNICDYRDDDDIPTVQEIKGAKVIGLEKTPYLNEIDAVAPWEETITPAGIPAIEEKGGQFIELFNPYAESLDISGWKLTGLLAVDAQNWGSIFSSCKTILDDLNNGDTVINPDTVKDILSKIVPVSVTIPDKQTIKPRSFYTIGDTVRIMIVLPPDGVPVLLFLPDKTPPKCDHYAAILAMNPGGPGRLFDVLRLIPWIKTKNLDFTLRLYDKENHLIEEAHYPFDTPVTTTQKNDPRMTGTGNWFPFSPTPGARNIVFQPWIGGEFDPVTGLVFWPSSFTVKNGSFSTIGELSRIHRMEHWRTLDFWKGGDERKLLDRLTVEERPEHPTFGRINVNTASETVLMCLPLVSRETARALVAARPFSDIGGILGNAGETGTPAGALSREITRYGRDFLDNNFDLIFDDEQEKEMIFSKIIGLITVRGNIFSITTTGQKVRDLNDNGTIEQNEVTAERKIRVVYDRRRQKIIFKEQR